MKLLTVQEVAQRLGLNVKTAYDQLARGVIPGRVKVGRCVRVREAELERWLAQGVGDANDGNL